MTLAGEIALVVVAAVAAAICIALVPAGSPRSRQTAQREPSRPDQLIKLERLAALAASDAMHVHAYLRPLLAEIAAARLAASGVTFDVLEGEAGQRLLGECLWELVRPGRPFPEDRRGPGVSTQELASMLDTLERL
jgi:hypothetical protein